jgi:hypothetical protein
LYRYFLTDTIEYNYNAIEGHNTTRYSSGSFLRPNSCLNGDAGVLDPVLENELFSTAPVQSFL